MLVTLEPCEMCKAVIKEARLKNIYYLIPRYEYKKLYKCTLFEHLDLDSEEKEKYLNNIQTFFKNKRR